MDAKKIKTIDDFFTEMRKKHSKDLKTAFGEIDKWDKEERGEHLYNNVITPGQDALYDSMKNYLREKVGDDTAKLKGKEKELKEAIVKSLRAYFEKAQPSVLKGTEGMDTEQQYEFLTHHYDMGVDPSGETKIYRGAAKRWSDKKKKLSVGKLITTLDTQRAKDKGQILNNTYSNFAKYHLDHYHDVEVAAHLKPEIEQHADIDDLVLYGKMNKYKLLHLRKDLKEGKLTNERGEAIDYSERGLKPKEKKT